MKERYIGIMSGTSLDGVDVALCQISEDACVLEASFFMPFSKDFKDEILLMIAETTTLQQVGQIDHKLALFFSEAVSCLLKNEHLSPEDIRAIGSHGQTLWHEPNGDYPFSMQLGDPSLIAVKTGIDVVADFRAKDVAMGGQGAPFAPAFHQFLFSNIKKCAVVNIGGMANITVLEPELIGYDTGCGNVLMDMWIQEKKQRSYDRDGAWAKSGSVNRQLLDTMLKDDYFNLNYPKSTGREYFNKKFLIKYLEPLGKIIDVDVQATLLALTVHSICNEIKKFDIKELLVCGGGARNLFLMYSLQEALPTVRVTTTDAYAVSSDNMEAMIFAWFAQMRLTEKPIALARVTGAKKSTILGGVFATN
ncbi:anhydro-N-acetylmuramic acid kinase [bacterium]|nr:anhydro-N-acetylmuramic acid kinase [bacterium]MBU1957861.1 anhydro-N-acetylmuramic acid kinase [bacterium]